MQTVKLTSNTLDHTLPDHDCLRSAILHHVNYSLGLTAEELQTVGRVPHCFFGNP